MERVLEGKTAIVTGPTSGIGRVIAEGLAARGAHVVLACRDAARGEATRAAIAQLVGSAVAEVLPLDAADPASIEAFAAAFRARHDRLHLLVNNAGINEPQRRTAPDGVELTFATNVLGYFRLVHALEDRLVAATPARVVNVASTYAGDLDLDDLQFTRRRYDSIRAYRQSKACDRLLTGAFSRRLAPRGVTVNSMSPGFVLTGLYRNLRGPSALFMRVLNLFIGVSVEAGADTALWLASAPELAGRTGGFHVKRQLTPCEFAGLEREEALFAICEKLGPR